MSYEILYYFEGHDIDIFEIKRDIISEDKSKVYFWVVYFKNDQIVKRLSFQSMDESSRTFIEGSLEFNSGEAVFTQGEHTFKLIKSNMQELAPKLVQKLESTIF